MILTSTALPQLRSQQAKIRKKIAITLRLQICSRHEQVDVEAQEEALEAELLENGLVALKEIQNINGLQITLPAGPASEGTELVSLCTQNLFNSHVFS